MSDMETLARCEMWLHAAKKWRDATNLKPIPVAVELGRQLRAETLQRDKKPAPIRVIDAAGVIVVQWGKP